MHDIVMTPVKVNDPRHVDQIRFGAKLDIRVASACDCPHGEVTAYWEESWMFEPWTPPSEASEPAPKHTAPESPPATHQHESA